MRKKFHDEILKLPVNLSECEIFFHKTFQIVHLILPSKCDLIITMNITKSILSAIADKNKTEVYFVSCSGNIDRLVKKAYPVVSSHLKVYRTDTHYFFSTANSSITSFDELTIKTKRTKEIDDFINIVVSNLKKSYTFKKYFH